jgi:HSP20 family protein
MKTREELIKERLSCGAARRHYAWYQHVHGSRTRTHQRPKYNVPMNIIENTDAYEVHVYALGFQKENIKLSIAEDILYISGTRELQEEAPNFINQEFPIRSFERIVSLRGQVDASLISARQEDGILKITLPKNQAAKTPAQEIKVQ